MLDLPLSKIILEGPKEELDLTSNTQPAIFLISYSIFNVIKKEFNIDLIKAKYFAGHSLRRIFGFIICWLFELFRNNKTFKSQRRCNAKRSAKRRGWNDSCFRINS